MQIISSLIFLWLLVFGLTGHAKPKEIEHKILVIIGDEKTVFNFVPAKKSVTLKDRAGKLSQFTLNDEGLKHFDGLFAQDFGPNDDLSKCPQKYVRYSSGSKVAKGCIGRPSKAAKGLTDLTNALSGLFADK